MFNKCSFIFLKNLNNFFSEDKNAEWMSELDNARLLLSAENDKGIFMSLPV